MLLVAAASRKLAASVLSILIEWPPCYSSHVERSRRCARGVMSSGRQIGAESLCAISLNSTMFGTTTRRLAQLCPDGRQTRSNRQDAASVAADHPRGPPKPRSGKRQGPVAGVSSPALIGNASAQRTSRNARASGPRRLRSKESELARGELRFRGSNCGSIWFQ
jgi:hypothetical protein